MTSAIERAADMLFGREDRVVLNIRFLCGGEANVSAEGLAEQIIFAESQIDAGRVRRIENVDQYLTELAA